MDINSLIAYVTALISKIDFYDLILPLLVYTLLIAAYGIFVWSFYKSVSKRDIFQLNIKDKKKQWQTKILYILKYLILFPVMTFLWFAALTIILFFLSKSQGTQNILLISMALIAATRITSYYKEELSQDIAKILPLAVLGIFVVDPLFFSFDLTISRFYEISTLAPLLVNYLLFTIVLEFVMRAILAIKRNISMWRCSRKKSTPAKSSSNRK